MSFRMNTEFLHACIRASPKGSSDRETPMPSKSRPERPEYSLAAGALCPFPAKPIQTEEIDTQLTHAPASNSLTRSGGAKHFTANRYAARQPWRKRPPLQRGLSPSFRLVLIPSFLLALLAWDQRLRPGPPLVGDRPRLHLRILRTPFAQFLPMASRSVDLGCY